jgi:hypothetical protein
MAKNSTYSAFLAAAKRPQMEEFDITYEDFLNLSTMYSDKQSHPVKNPYASIRKGSALHRIAIALTSSPGYCSAVIDKPVFPWGDVREEPAIDGGAFLTRIPLDIVEDAKSFLHDRWVSSVGTGECKLFLGELTDHRVKNLCAVIGFSAEKTDRLAAMYMQNPEFCSEFIEEFLCVSSMPKIAEAVRKQDAADKNKVPERDQDLQKAKEEYVKHQAEIAKNVMSSEPPKRTSNRDIGAKLAEHIREKFKEVPSVGEVLIANVESVLQHYTAKGWQIRDWSGFAQQKMLSEALAKSCLFTFTLMSDKSYHLNRIMDAIILDDVIVEMCREEEARATAAASSSSDHPTEEVKAVEASGVDDNEISTQTEGARVTSTISP